MLLSNLCIAQHQGSTEWYGTWEFGLPVGNNFVTNFSALGFHMGFARFIKDDLAIGIESGWNNYYQYAPKKTYQFTDGAATTDLYKYIYTLPITLTVTHFFKAGDLLTPYVRLGLGAQYSEQNLYYNVYESTNTNWGFIAIPEIGTHIHFDKHSPWSMDLGVRYKYSTNSAPDLGVSNVQTLNFSVGFDYTLK
jgi:hypothetical protein